MGGCKVILRIAYSKLEYLFVNCQQLHMWYHPLPTVKRFSWWLELLCPGMVRFLCLHALFKSLSLGIFFIAFSVSLGIVFVGEVDDDFPFSVSVDGSLGSTIEDVRGTDVAAGLVVVLSVRVTPEEKK